MAQPNRWGGKFIVEDSLPEVVAIPEDLTIKQQKLAAAARQWVREEMISKGAEMEELHYERNSKWMLMAGERRLLEGGSLSEQVEDGMDMTSAVLLAEAFAESGSFALSVEAHKSLGIVPIALFGTAEQKQNYLPSLIAGTTIAAFGLTEPSAGSDARGVKMTARLSPAGDSYILNGSKLYVTNAGVASLFILFAKVDGDDFTAFIVERGASGLTVGPEERQLGAEGVSSCPLTLDHTPIPVSHVLGTIGQGHRVAFSVLNYGRLMQAASCAGLQKQSLALAIQYAGKRKQFGRPLSSYPLIGAKLADMNIAAYVTESMVYRTAGAMTEAAAVLRRTEGENAEGKEVEEEGESEAALVRLLEDYGIECSVNKIFASEALGYVVDESVQIHGGYGLSRDSKIEQLFRDARMSRISEGTNEMNRLLIPGLLMKKALRGELPLLRKARTVQADLQHPQPMPPFPGILDKEVYRIRQAKKVLLAVGGLAIQKRGLALEQEQEMLSLLADMMVQIYAMESTALRTRKRMKTQASAPHHEPVRNAVQMTVIFIQEAMERIDRYAKQILAALEEGDALQTHLSVLKKLMRAPLPDIVGLKRQVAAHILRSGNFVT